MSDTESKARRTVEDNLLVSEDDPPLRMRIDERLDFVGELSFVLYNVAYVDLFVFATRPAAQQPGLLLVQFEHFLDNNSHTYNYPSPLIVRLGEHEYQYDIMAGNITSRVAERPDSDSARALALLQEKGYRVPDDAMWVRFVRVLDEARRREILFSYSEDLSTHGVTAAELEPGGRADEQRDQLFHELLQRALKAFEIVEG